MACSATSTSTSRSSSSPSRSMPAQLLARAAASALVARTVGRHADRRAPAAAAGRAAAPRRASRARTATFARSSSRTMLDRELGEVADDRLDVAADVADLGELRRLDLDERRAARACARRRAISVFPTPVGPIMMMFFGAISSRRSLGDLLPAPAVAQRDRDRALGLALADDVAVELGDDLARRHRARRVVARRVAAATARRCRWLGVALLRRSGARSPRSRAGRWCRCRSRRRCASPPRRSARASSVGVRDQRARRGERVGAARADRDRDRRPSGSMTSPVPETARARARRRPTTSIASSRRSTRSVRQSFASSTAARRSWPRCSSSFSSKPLEQREARRRDAPAKPAITCSRSRRRTLRALRFMTVSPTSPGRRRRCRRGAAADREDGGGVDDGSGLRHARVYGSARAMSMPGRRAGACRSALRRAGGSAGRPGGAASGSTCV